MCAGGASKNLEKYGPWALIIGGSEGIGSSFARKLAAKKFNVALVARRTQPLDEVATELRPTGVQVRTLSADLSGPDALEKVRTITDDIEIGCLIYVAGANSVRGNFVELAPEVYRAVELLTPGLRARTVESTLRRIHRRCM
jgi:short-subunit dehydrogenase